MKKLLFAIAFIFMFSTVDVNAFVNGQKYSQYLLLYADFQGWSSPSAYTSLGTAYHSDSTGINTDNQVAYYYLPQSNLYNDTNGTSVKTYINGQIVKDNQVELSVGLCSTRTIDFINSYVLYLVDSSGNFHFQSLSANTENDLGTYVTDAYTFYCKEYYLTFTASVTSSSYVFRFYSSSTKPMGTLAYMGYHLNINGIDYTSQFNNLSNQNQILINQNETIINQNQATNDKLDNIDDSITSEEAPNKLDNLNDSAGWLPAGPVDSILNLPLTMFQNLSNNIGASCTPLEINLPYVDTNITLPCLNSIYEQIDGLSIWINSIGVIASAFMLYSYLLKLYKWVDDTLTFRENNHIDNWGGI